MYIYIYICICIICNALDRDHREDASSPQNEAPCSDIMAGDMGEHGEADGDPGAAEGAGKDVDELDPGSGVCVRMCVCVCVCVCV